MKRRCQKCKEYRNCQDSFASWIFFIIGLIATVAIRVITVLIHMNPIYAKIAWYMGVGGFFLFFIYKFKVSHNRAEAIAERNLIEKIDNRRGLTAEDYGLIGDIFCGLNSKKEKINYFFIFVLSGIALILAIYMDFFR